MLQGKLVSGRIIITRSLGGAFHVNVAKQLRACFSESEINRLVQKYISILQDDLSIPGVDVLVSEEPRKKLPKQKLKREHETFESGFSGIH